MSTRNSPPAPLAATLSLLSAMAAAGAESPGDSTASQGEALRFPTPDERVYLAIAWDTGLAAVCERISPQAYEEWLFNPRGRQIALARSRCYMGVAENTRDVSLCDRVLTISAALEDGSQYSAETCRATAAGDPDRNQLFPRHDALRRVLEQLGYGLDDVLRQCDAYLDERSAWLRSSAGETVRAQIQASPDPALDGRETPARAHPRHDRVLLDEFLFGPYDVSEYDRPHRLCSRFFDVEQRAQPFEIRFAVKDRTTVEQAYEKNIYNIYLTLARTPEFRQRIVSRELP